MHDVIDYPITTTAAAAAAATAYLPACLPACTSIRSIYLPSNFTMVGKDAAW